MWAEEAFNYFLFLSLKFANDKSQCINQIHKCVLDATLKIGTKAQNDIKEKFYSCGCCFCHCCNQDYASNHHCQQPQQVERPPSVCTPSQPTVEVSTEHPSTPTTNFRPSSTISPTTPIVKTTISDTSSQIKDETTKSCGKKEESTTTQTTPITSEAIRTTEQAQALTHQSTVASTTSKRQVSSNAGMTETIVDHESITTQESLPPIVSTKQSTPNEEIQTTTTLTITSTKKSSKESPITTSTKSFESTLSGGTSTSTMGEETTSKRQVSSNAGMTETIVDHESIATQESLPPIVSTKQSTPNEDIQTITTLTITSTKKSSTEAPITTSTKSFESTLNGGTSTSTMGEETTQASTTQDYKNLSTEQIKTQPSFPSNYETSATSTVAHTEKSRETVTMTESKTTKEFLKQEPTTQKSSTITEFSTQTEKQFSTSEVEMTSENEDSTAESTMPEVSSKSKEESEEETEAFPSSSISSNSNEETISDVTSEGLQNAPISRSRVKEISSSTISIENTTFDQSTWPKQSSNTSEQPEQSTISTENPGESFNENEDEDGSNETPKMSSEDLGTPSTNEQTTVIEGAKSSESTNVSNSENSRKPIFIFVPLSEVPTTTVPSTTKEPEKCVRVGVHNVTANDGFEVEVEDTIINPNYDGMLDLKETPMTECLPKWSKSVWRKQICAGSIKEGADAGVYDGGAPIMYKHPFLERMFLAGVSSFVSHKDEKTNSVHTRVSRYLKWIMRKTKDATYCD
ncbi:hypothetical protein B4U79_04855 [Dinothrombium tinctorium]|uniref:Peptidase S1 domain-containing protein n=1 Tax=Dinothrombium tinctorium TaxID=1965070 RepID=A0A443RFC9_9ACAR|nr:hypothetical protein B4U79_04855 [Dinothrombium tinctorium]